MNFKIYKTHYFRALVTFEIIFLFSKGWMLCIDSDVANIKMQIGLNN